MSLAKTNMHHL
uniref:Uncharacterized protein n=1 Tax=Arundo donax TaxID=35708 RepID=A0A0A8Y7U2_ARUDO